MFAVAIKIKSRILDDNLKKEKKTTIWDNNNSFEGRVLRLYLKVLSLAKLDGFQKAMIDIFMLHF